jgi:hypothetical protein
MSLPLALFVEVEFSLSTLNLVIVVWVRKKNKKLDSELFPHFHHG